MIGSFVRSDESKWAAFGIVVDKQENIYGVKWFDPLEGANHGAHDITKHSKYVVNLMEIYYREWTELVDKQVDNDRKVC